MPEGDRPSLATLDALDALAPIAEYRDCPEKLVSAVTLMEQTIADLEARLEATEGVRERAEFALSAIERLVATTQQRAGQCMEIHTSVACENTDILGLVRDWIIIARRGIDESS